MRKIQLIDCISKVYINKKLQNLKDKEAILKSLIHNSSCSDEFVREKVKDIQPIIVKIKGRESYSTQKLLNEYRLNKINKYPK